MIEMKISTTRKLNSFSINETLLGGIGQGNSSRQWGSGNFGKDTDIQLQIRPHESTHFGLDVLSEY
jgi:hypothetical protein